MDNGNRHLASTSVSSQVYSEFCALTEQCLCLQVPKGDFSLFLRTLLSCEVFNKLLCDIFIGLWCLWGKSLTEG